MKEIIVGENEATRRLDGFLSSYLKDASKGFIYKMLRKKNITLNDKKADGKEKLKVGDSIKIYFSDETLLKFRGDEDHKFKSSSFDISTKYGPLPVIYEDDNIVLVNKPRGMLSQKAEPGDISLNEWLIEYLLQKGDITEKSLETFRPSICNRLDRNTTGLIICGKSLAGLQKMNELIRDRSVKKFYRTVVKGKVTAPMTVKGFLFKDEKTNKVEIADRALNDEYSYIETAYEPLEYFGDSNLTLLEVELITGKPHQIRAHLSSLGHPLVGDVKYGGPKLLGMKCQLLHSYRLKFPDDLKEPFDSLNGREFIAPLPDEFPAYQTNFCR